MVTEGLSSAAIPDWDPSGLRSTSLGATLEDSVIVSIPDSIIADAGDTVSVPIMIDDVTGLGIVAIDMQMDWAECQSGLLTYLGCEAGDVLVNAGWDPPDCSSSGGSNATVTAGGTAQLSGEGTLFYLNLWVSYNAKPCMSCVLSFTYAVVSDSAGALPTATDPGSVIIESCFADGYVKAWYCDTSGGDTVLTHGLDGVRVNLSDCQAPIFTVFTDQYGYYSWSCLNVPDQQCPYCVDLEYWDIPETITAYDAALVLCYLICMETLTACPFEACGSTLYPQMIAADVSASGTITAYDASLIVQYVVGALPAFPYLDTWLMYATPCETCFSTCPTRIDYIGVAVGDVSGPVPTPAPPHEEVFVGFGDPVYYEDSLEVPIIVEGAYDIYSVEIDVIFNTDDLSFISAETSDLMIGFFGADRAEGSILRIATAGMTEVVGDGEIAVLTFGKKNPIEELGTRVVISDVMFNEGYPPADVGAPAGLTPHPTAVTIGPIAPNPFRSQTSISLALPERTDVVVRVYDVSGRMVVTLIDRPMAEGAHSVLWNGTDVAGRRMAEGIYFCHIRAGDHSSTRKIVLAH
jgi:hypothetical protein